MVTRVEIRTSGQGLFEFTDRVQDVVSSAGVREGLCTVMIQHTSASLTVQENADPSARRDLEDWLNRLVPEGDSHFTHTQEGPDDMPSHIKAALTATTLSIPIQNGRLALGTWQGIFLWEHRRRGSTRQCVVHVGALKALAGDQTNLAIEWPQQGSVSDHCFEACRVSQCPLRLLEPARHLHELLIPEPHPSMKRRLERHTLSEVS